MTPPCPERQPSCAGTAAGPALYGGRARRSSQHGQTAARQDLRRRRATAPGRRVVTTRGRHQYFPKRASVGGYSQEELDAVAQRLNGRPRRTLGWLSHRRNSSRCCADPVSPQVLAVASFHGAAGRPRCRPHRQPGCDVGTALPSLSISQLVLPVSGELTLGSSNGIRLPTRDTVRLVAGDNEPVDVGVVGRRSPAMSGASRRLDAPPTPTRVDEVPAARSGLRPSPASSVLSSAGTDALLM